MPGKCFDIDEAVNKESEFRVKKPKSIPAFRGFLEISPMVSIAVWSYLRIVPNSYPAPKKVRKKNGEEVKTVSTFYSKKDAKKTKIAKEDQVKVWFIVVSMRFCSLSGVQIRQVDYIIGKL